MNFSDDEMGLIWKALNTREDVVGMMRRELQHRSDTSSHNVIERFDRKKQQINMLLNRMRFEYFKKA